MNTDQKFQILLVEDNLPDVEMLKFLLSRCPLNYNLHVAVNGRDATDFLKKTGNFTQAPTPDLILMDLNVPLKDGKEQLKEIRANDELCRIPVVILSTSSSEQEIQEAYCLGANAFITKPTDLNVFQSRIEKLVAFWFESVALPTRSVAMI